MLARVFSWLLVIVASAAGTGCGPSMRMLHESTTYFERCHAAELSSAVPVEERYECWQRWLRWYTTGQEQARILYARERLVYLAQGEEIAPLPAADAGVEAGEPVAIASGTPSAVGDGGARSTSGTTRSYDESLRDRYRPNPRSQGNTVCAPLCRPRWDQCVDACPNDARPCVAACEASHRACMQSCF